MVQERTIVCMARHFCIENTAMRDATHMVWNGVGEYEVTVTSERHRCSVSLLIKSDGDGNCRSGMSFQLLDPDAKLPRLGSLCPLPFPIEPN